MSTGKILIIIILSFMLLSSSIAGGYAFYRLRNPPTFTLDNSMKLTKPDENGFPMALDKHNVTCNNNAINQFSLIRHKDNFNDKIFYNYKCAASEKLETPREVTNPKTEANNQIIYLDRQNIKCNENEVISSFKLSNALGEWQYFYTCSKAKDPLTCRSIQTTPAKQGNAASSLVPLSVQCEPNEALSQFNLHNIGNGDMQYNYTCCKQDVK
jgi:hypothetical protein